jgi:23S rRNA (uracil1939-C5)-methyltransferase
MRTVELTIHDVAFGGKGVARDGGKAVFVPYTIDGETITAEVVREKKQFAEGELVAIQEKSPHRVSPPCPYFGRCGGCAYQHIDYEHQVGIKWRQVRDVLRRIGKIPEPPLRPIIPSPDCYGYRNRITVHVQDGVIGFFRRESNRLIDIEACPISREEVNQELRRLRESAPRDGHYTLRASAGPRVFSQTNDTVGEALRQLVVGLIAPNQELLIDAFCGSGFFAKALVEKFNRIIGIDWDQFAIEEARKTASGKEIYIAGDVEAVLVAAAHPRSQQDFGNPDRIAIPESTKQPQADSVPWPLGSMAGATLIVDPPAIGLTNGIRKSIIDIAPDAVIYVSCNPATLARDLNDLAQAFDIVSITPLDMFPQTAEIEAVAHLKRRSERYVEELNDEIAA